MIESILEDAYTAELASKTVESFREIERRYALGDWRPGQMGGGLFVESVRRILELEITGSYTDISDDLSSFHQGTLTKYEQEGQGKHESYRMLIPRALWSMYSIRNKRAGHLNDVSPNKADCTYILYSAKWVLAELVRLNSGLSTSETQELVTGLVEREIELLWKRDGIERILDTDLKAEKAVLVLLFNSSPRTDEELRSIVEYSNKYVFQDKLRDLHEDRLIYYADDGTCRITPKGEVQAEEIIEESHYGA